MRSCPIGAVSSNDCIVNIAVRGIRHVLARSVRLASAGVQKVEQVRRKHIRLTRQKIVAGSIVCERYHCGFRS